MFTEAEEYYDMKEVKTTKHKFLGKGTYGCTVMPGLDCKENK